MSEGEDGREEASARMGDRDWQIVRALMEARYLSFDQLRRLFFVGRTRQAVSKRLVALVKSDIVRTDSLATLSGRLYLYSLGDAGARVARDISDGEVEAGAPMEAVSFEHHLLFTELYVSLMTAGLKPGDYARAEHPAWSWSTAGAATTLPWKDYGDGGKDKRLIPDAVLSMHEAGRRIFVEGETGSHPIRSKNADKQGSTLAKVQRYDAVVSQRPLGGAKTWYESQYGDGLTPELLFLVKTQTRASNVMAAVNEMRKAKGGGALVVRALTLEGALRVLGLGASRSQAGASRSLLSPSSPPQALAAPKALTTRDGYVLGDEEVRSLTRFLMEYREDLKARRAAAEAARQAAPVVPRDYSAVKLVLKRLYDERKARGA